jgi:hypothetical protein
MFNCYYNLAFLYCDNKPYTIDAVEVTRILNDVTFTSFWCVLYSTNSKVPVPVYVKKTNITDYLNWSTVRKDDSCQSEDAPTYVVGKANLYLAKAESIHQSKTINGNGNGTVNIDKNRIAFTGRMQKSLKNLDFETIDGEVYGFFCQTGVNCNKYVLLDDVFFSKWKGSFITFQTLLSTTIIPTTKAFGQPVQGVMRVIGKWEQLQEAIEKEPVYTLLDGKLIIS